MIQSMIALACLMVSFGFFASTELDAAGAASLYSNPATPAKLCPVTQPNGNMPPGAGNPVYVGGYGNAALWTNVWMWGKDGVTLPADDGHIQPNGAIADLKWAWYRYVPGTLTSPGAGSMDRQVRFKPGFQKVTATMAFRRPASRFQAPVAGRSRDASARPA